jgi:hypothetical protein
MIACPLAQLPSYPNVRFVALILLSVFRTILLVGLCSDPSAVEDISAVAINTES